MIVAMDVLNNKWKQGHPVSVVPPLLKHVLMTSAIPPSRSIRIQIRNVHPSVSLMPTPWRRTRVRLPHQHRFESCWPAIVKGMDGVVLVYNPEIPTHDIEVGIW